MFKLTLKNFFVGTFFMLLSSMIVGLLSIVLSLLAKIISIPYNTIPTYFLGGVIVIMTFFIFKKFFTQKGYFLQKDIDDPKQNSSKNIWIKNIKNGKFVKRWAAYATYIPCLIMCLGLIVLAFYLYPILQNGGTTQSYVFYAVISGIIGASISSLLIFIVFSIKSTQVCKKCGAVNAFIYDEYLDFNKSISGGSLSYTCYSNPYGMTGIEPVNTPKTSKYRETVSRHCAYCGEKSTYTETYYESNIIRK